jgi:hypothetical protein
MLIRWFTYLAVGIFLVVLADIISARLGIRVDIAWLLVASAAFLYPAELAPIAGLTFGIVLDSLSGSIGVYSISYLGFGTIVVLFRKAFFLGGFIPAWILAVVGAEFLWLFFGAYARAIVLLGGAAQVPGFISPYLLSTLIGFPLVYWLSRFVLIRPVDKSRRAFYGATTRIIDKT